MEYVFLLDLKTDNFTGDAVVWCTGNNPMNFCRIVDTERVQRTYQKDEEEEV